jgi:hypothetical protein
MERRCICGDGVWFYINKCPKCQMEKQCHTSDKYAVKSHCPLHYKSGNPLKSSPKTYYSRLCDTCAAPTQPVRDGCCVCKYCTQQERCYESPASQGDCCNCKVYFRRMDQWLASRAAQE